MSSVPDNVSPAMELSDEARLMASLRAILLDAERERLAALEARTQHLEGEILRAVTARRSEVTTLQEQLTAAEARAAEQARYIERLEARLGELLARQEAEAETLIPRITRALSEITDDAVAGQPEEMADALGPIVADATRVQITHSRTNMVDALGPIMGEAVRRQIRDSRQEMIDALHPIIGLSITRAIAEAIRDLQNSIDVRLKSTTQGPQNIFRALSARLRGVSRAELMLRDALPFSVDEIFLIQTRSGLLMAHSHPGSLEVGDHDLIGGMLTAIRDFVRDSFGDGREEEELATIEYGNRDIIVTVGPAAYLATVITGAPPTGLRGRLRDYVTQLHVRHEGRLRDFDGDPSSLPPSLQPELAQLAVMLGDAAAEPAREPLDPATRRGLYVLGLLLALLFACAIFYLWLGIRLLPLALGA